MTAPLVLKYCKIVIKDLVLPPSGVLLLALLGLLLLRRVARVGRTLILIEIHTRCRVTKLMA